MSCEGGHLLQGRVLPHNDLVVGVAVGGYDLLCVLAEHQVANLGASVDTVEESVVESVPELNGLVCCASSGGQYSVVVGRPRYALHCCHMVAKLANRRGGVVGPNEQLVVVAT